MVSESVWALVSDAGMRLSAVSRAKIIITRIVLFRIGLKGVETCHHYTIWLKLIIALTVCQCMGGKINETFMK
jgi:hypothetical protein